MFRHKRLKSGGNQNSKNSRTLRYQDLESRQLLAAVLVNDAGGGIASNRIPSNSVAVAGMTETGMLETMQAAGDAAAQEIASEHELRLPRGLPNDFSVSIDFSGERLTLQLKKNSVFGENTRFLVDDGSGKLVEIDPGVDRSYLGSVAERPGFVVSAWLGDNGLMANIIRPNQPSIVVAPQGDGLHRVSLDEAEGPVSHDHGDDEVLHEDEIAASESAITTTDLEQTPLAANAVSSAATLPPTRVMDVYEYEIAVEIGSAAFLNNYGGDLSYAQSVAAGIPANLDARFLHAAGIKHRLGTVIIRQSAAEDPFTVANGTDSAGLSAFRNYWNSNPQEVGNTHDLAVYHVRGGPSGLAWVNNVGTTRRYLLSASNGATSWANGTLAHEVGHQWNLPHVSTSIFYESRPREDGNAAGGDDRFVSIMSGSGTHNVGRLSTGEADRVFSARQNKLGFGDLVTNPGNVKPFGYSDSFVATGDPIVIDVIANDYDVNNDVLNVQLRDTISQQGGSISVSIGTGPGGRDELIYTPPAGAQGEDFFHYIVIDSTGQRDWGAVYVDNQGPNTIDLNQAVYFYDLGTPTSPVFSGSDPYERISEATFGDLGFTMPTNPSGFVVESRDREENGQISGVNDLNRDHIRLKSAASFHHKLADGIYRVLLTVGDVSESTNAIRFTAEGSDSLTTVAHTPNMATNYTLQDVRVDDGELSLDIENLGFSSNINRIIITRTAEIVDTSQTEFIYDPGTSDSLVFARATQLTPDIQGEISFSGGAVTATDRGSLAGNGFNRDFIGGTAAATFNHVVANGHYEVKLNMSDQSTDLDNMYVAAEGVTLASGIDRPIGQNGTFSIEFDVVDGELNLTFGDADPTNQQWAVNRIVLKRVGNADAAAPTLTSIMRFSPTANVTAANSLEFHVLFDEAVTDLDASDFDATGTSANVTSVTPIQGTGEQAYYVTVSGGNLSTFNGIVGLDLSPTQDIADSAGNALPDQEPSIDQTYSLDNVAPKVSSIVIDDGTLQRSRVRSVTVNFDSPIVFGAGAFDLRSTAGTVVPVTSNVTAGTQTSQATLTFPAAINESLADGNYRLTVQGASVHDFAGNQMDGNGGSGTSHVDDFFRLFGDATGDRSVGLSDFALFRATFGKGSTETGYNAGFDFDNDNSIGLSDFAAFRRTFGPELDP